MITHLPFALDAPSQARSMLTEDLRRSGLPTLTIEDAEVIVGELVANAVEHGRPDPHGEVEVSWELHDDHLLIGVLDSGRPAHAPRAKPMTRDEPRGRGLAMVDLLSDSWAVDIREGVHVTARLLFSAANA